MPPAEQSARAPRPVPSEPPIDAAAIEVRPDPTRRSDLLRVLARVLRDEAAQDLGAAVTRTGVGEEITVIRISYDSRTDQLEYLAAAVQILKGSCCYEATLPAPKTESWVLPDGTLEVRTTDADPYFAEDRAVQALELQAALDAFRAGGCPRPVVVRCVGDDEQTALLWRQLEPALKQAGKSVANASDQWLPHYVVATDVARRLLLPFTGKAASRYFRTPGVACGVLERGYTPRRPQSLRKPHLQGHG